MADGDSLNKKLALAGALIGVVSGVIGAAAAYLTIDREDHKVAISETGADRDYLLKVTDKALQLAVSDNIKQRCLVSYLVGTLPDRYGEYRSGLLAVVDEADTSGATSFCVQGALDKIAEKQAAEAASSDGIRASGTLVVPAAPTSTDTASTTSIISSGGGIYALDIFWCDGRPDSGNRQSLATRVALEVKKLDKIGRVRVRPLPLAINEQKGYRIAKNLVRYERSEDSIASALVAMSNLGVQFVPNLIKYKTTDYVSMFVCGPIA